MQVKEETLIFIVGPTATGKTSLAIKLARRIKGEIISCDSMQVYKGMNILSQSPSPAETKRVKYHLIRFLSPEKEFSAAAFVKKSVKLINGITRLKKTPIIVGGTGLYVKGLIDGLFPTPEADMAFRKKMYDYANRHGSGRLHKKLKKIDEASAAIIHPNDTRRIVRALEIWHSTGKTMTELKKETKGLIAEYNIKIFALKAPREMLYSNINKRVDLMFSDGILPEVRRLSKKKLSKTAKAALGIKEIVSCLEGQRSIEEAKEIMKRNTRRYAKRQLTWFRADKRIIWFDITKLSKEAIISRIRKEIRY